MMPPAFRKVAVILVVLVVLSACQIFSAAPATPPAAEPAVTLPPAQPTIAPTATLSQAPQTAVQPQPPTPTTIPPTAVEYPTQRPPTQPPPTPPKPTLPPPQPGTGFAVVLVLEDDGLNIRANPGADQAILETLPPNATAVEATGEVRLVGDDRWLGVWSETGPGWANAYYLTEWVTPQGFCADPASRRLIDQFTAAIRAGDGEALAALVSPVHGLSLHYLRGGNVANYSPEEAKFLFSSTYEMDWGLHPGSGLTVTGSFHTEVLPKLEDVLADANLVVTCNDAQLGGATYEYQWPAEYQNINYYSLHKPGSPEVELDWRTWLVGVEYVEGNPYLFALVHLMWEP